MYYDNQPLAPAPYLKGKLISIMLNFSFNIAESLTNFIDQGLKVKLMSFRFVSTISKQLAYGMTQLWKTH